MVGKRIRLSKLFNPKSNRTCIVPMDHGISCGPIDGLTNTVQTVHSVIKGGADAVILHKGLLKELSEHTEIARAGNFIVHISASTDFSETKHHKCLVSTVEHAVKLGAAGISVHVNLGTSTEGKMLSDLGLVSDACMDWGMPLLAMMYIKGERNNNTCINSIAHAARVAEELGADIVKVDIPFGASNIKKVMDCVSIPVIISGGPKVSVNDILLHIETALEAGASGISIGRNIFQSENPELMTRIISQMVHEGLSFEAAVKKL
jgi:predicted phospho-2-dehydro-3-deoxyheptonate aldolase